VSLFIERAGAVLPGFEVDDRNRHAVVELCRRLDGVPLALELAALRLRALAPDQIVAELEDRYLLSKGNRSAPQRQQTLYALVDWSYQLCSEPERLLWHILSVFEGGFELDAVREVCATSALAGQDLVEPTIGLVEKSVLVREAHGDTLRYRMPVLIRDYGLERLRQSRHERSVRRSHRDWCEALAARVYAEWVGPEQLSWFNRVRREQANFRAALEFSLTEPGEASHAVDTIVSMVGPVLAFGFLGEGRLWLDRALRQFPEPGLTQARALRAASHLAALQGDHPVAAAMLSESRELTEQVGDVAELARVAHVGDWWRSAMPTSRLPPRCMRRRVRASRPPETPGGSSRPYPSSRSPTRCPGTRIAPHTGSMSSGRKWNPGSVGIPDGCCGHWESRSGG
jgi:hypothetical protein